MGNFSYGTISGNFPCWFLSSKMLHEGLRVHLPDIPSRSQYNSFIQASRVEILVSTLPQRWQLLKCSPMGSHLGLFLFYIFPKKSFFTFNLQRVSAYFWPLEFFIHRKWAILVCYPMGSPLNLFLFCVILGKLFWV